MTTKILNPRHVTHKHTDTESNDVSRLCLQIESKNTDTESNDVSRLCLQIESKNTDIGDIIQDYFLTFIEIEQGCLYLKTY